MQASQIIRRADNAQSTLVASDACLRRRPFKLKASDLKRWPFVGPDGQVSEAARRGCFAAEIEAIYARAQR